MDLELRQPDIFAFSDYREYLVHYHKYKSERQKSWSLGVWRNILGLKSKAMLSMILSGKRHPGARCIDALVQYFKFSEAEARYFKALIQFQKRRKLVSTKIQMTKAAPQEACDLLMNPDTYLLREMVSLKEFRNSSVWISERTKRRLPHEHVESMLKQLTKSGLLSTDANESLVAPKIEFTQINPSDAQKESFHKRVIEASLQNLTDTPEDQRAYQVSFINIKRENIGLARELVRQFQKEFSELVSEESGDEVYQLSIQLHPLTQSITVHKNC